MERVGGHKIEEIHLHLHKKSNKIGGGRGKMSMLMSLSSSSWCTAAAADLQSSIVRRSCGGVVGTAGAVSSPGRLQLQCFSSSRCSTYGYGNMKFSDNTMIRIIRRRPKKTITSISCFSALNPELKSTLDKVVTSHKVILFMKGTKEFPQCGFSNTVVQILKSLNVPFETVNILENEVLRQGLKEYSNWPTFPQLYIEGEFFGGCDITVDAYKTGELHEQLEKAMCS